MGSMLLHGHPDGKHIASGGIDNTVQVWDTATGTPVFIYKGHSDWVIAIAWSPDGKYLASGGADNTVQVWNAATGTPVFIYKGHSDSVIAIA